MTRVPPGKLLDNLRTWRNTPERDLSLMAVVGAAKRELTSRARNLGALGPAWRELVPPALADRSRLAGLSRGVLTVKCEDASTKFELDRWLRAGGETALIKRAAARLTRVRLTQ